MQYIIDKEINAKYDSHVIVMTTIFLGEDTKILCYIKTKFYIVITKIPNYKL